MRLQTSVLCSGGGESGNEATNFSVLILEEGSLGMRLQTSALCSGGGESGNEATKLD